MAHHKLMTDRANTMLAWFGQPASITDANGSWPVRLALRSPSVVADLGGRIEVRGESPQAWGLHADLAGIARGAVVDTGGRSYEVQEILHDEWRVLDTLVLAPVPA